jgi:SAM-dependent methyltransferase
MANIPLPPPELIERVGAIEDPVGRYVSIGEHQRAVLAHYLGDGWDWSGRVLLDWGCGAGRLLRLMADSPATLIGVEIDEASIAWMAKHIPRVQGLLVEKPVLELPDESVDVVTGFSVMTHISDEWAPWLLEVRRVLKPGGLAILSFIGALTAPLLCDQWNPDRLGMLVLRYANPSLSGGPDVIHSPWWIREHWGRAFTVRSMEPDPLQPEPGQHDFAVLERPTGPPPTAEQLTSLADDARELAGLESALQRTRSELAVMQDQRARIAELEHELTAMHSTLSWRVTEPLRRLRQLQMQIAKARARGTAR